MSPPSSTPDAGPLAAEFCRGLPLEKSSRLLIRPDQSVERFIRALAAAGQFNDATRVLAHLLPTREAIWWALGCARLHPLPDAPAEVEAALAAVQTWVVEMSDESRLEARAAADAAEIGTAAGCVAMAASVTGGSMAPPGAPPLPPPPTLPAQYVAASILISALMPDPEGAPERYRTFLKHGLELYEVTGGIHAGDAGGRID